jgi:hypothetical protein
MVARGSEQQELFGRWIEPNPASAEAAEALVLPGCISVWLLIGQLKLDYRKAELVAAQYDLPIEAIRAATAYYSFFQNEIDARILANRSFFSS